MNTTPMTFLSSTREGKLSCEHSPNRQWFIQMSEDHPFNSNYRHNTGFFYVVIDVPRQELLKLSLRVLFSIKSLKRAPLKRSSSKIADDNCLCWLNRKGLDDCKNFTLKLKWNSISTTAELAIVYFPCFYYYELILSTSHDVNVETIQFHIFLTFSCLMQRLINMKMYDKQLYANVEDLLV